MNEKTGDTTWQPDGSGGVQPQRVGGGSRSSQLPQDLIREAPADGSPYVRQDAGWVPAPQPAVGEAPIDGGLYLRSDGAWALYTPPSPGVEEAPDDADVYVRGRNAWEVGVPEAPKDAKSYVRNSGSWRALTVKQNWGRQSVSASSGSSTANRIVYYSSGDNTGVSTIQNARVLVTVEDFQGRIVGYADSIDSQSFRLSLRRQDDNALPLITYVSWHAIGT